MLMMPLSGCSLLRDLRSFPSFIQVLLPWSCPRICCSSLDKEAGSALACSLSAQSEGGDWTTILSSPVSCFACFHGCWLLFARKTLDFSACEQEYFLRLLIDCLRKRGQRHMAFLSSHIKQSFKGFFGLGRIQRIWVWEWSGTLGVTVLPWFCVLDLGPHILEESTS